MHVVHVKSHAFAHYIGRGWMPRVPASKVQPAHANLGNPFVIGQRLPFRHGPGLDRAQVISEYETWARSKPEVMERIKALPENAVLGCWCKPQACHGDVIVKLWKEMHISAIPFLELDL
jgi:hypothetical protein